MDYDVEELLSGAEELDVSVSREDSGIYRVEVALEYGGEDMELTLRSLESPDQLGNFYDRYLSDISGDGASGVYGNSEYVERSLEGEDTWGLTRSEEWAVDIYRSLRKNKSWAESDDSLIDHVSASTLAAVSMSESYGEERTEDYSFYLSLINDLESEPSRGIRERVKDRAKDRVKREAKDTAVMAKEEAEKEWRRMKREGEIEEAKQKAKEMAKQKAVDAARGFWKDKKQSVRDGVRSKVAGAQEYAERKRREIAEDEASDENEGPELVLKLESDGITVYEYGDISEGSDSDES